MTQPGSTLANIITWVRRIIKSPSEQSISDDTIIDYINRFYLYDVPARVQLFELKRQYTFETIPNQFIYQFPFLSYNWINQPIYCDGVQMGFYQSNDQFYKIYPELVQNEQIATGNNDAGTEYTGFLGQSPILRGFIDDNDNLQPYVYFTAQDTAFHQLYVVDSGYLDTSGRGVLIQTDATFQNIIGPPLNKTAHTGYPDTATCDTGFINYLTGEYSVKFSTAIPGTNLVYNQSSPYSSGFPRIALFFNNTLKLYPVPDRSYKIQLDAYITPAQFMAEDTVTFNYMSEYLARGAARKILSDTGDTEQLQLYEPFFREQENFVLRRTDRQRAVTRVPTIFSAVTAQSQYTNTQY